MIHAYESHNKIISSKIHFSPLLGGQWDIDYQTLYAFILDFYFDNINFPHLYELVGWTTGT